ncbi:MAG: lytic murein transglycosylase B [Betaproteobacteria bacterium AqS2]|uniref:Lytic murein transglycosylase B n=1 Tax=Candidatus Amphirhobacter heronislandensis TaxID=1732024 RepID=A0A930UIT1_9GAMM|nr:lytic murein transglycosylase B [Betaproteobacteria bacterium AqS2]
MRRRALLAGPLLLLLPWRARAALLEQAEGFIDELVANDGFERAYLEEVFGQLRLNPKVIELIKPPAEGGRVVHWDEYRGRHVTYRKIRNGASFAREHAEALARAEAAYGVPAEIIVAIIGVETRYGGYTGNFGTAEALATLAFGYPPRAEYFRKELRQLFIYARNAGFDVLELRGSYAGAMGVPQFMPTSALEWAVDFDRSGQPDLFAPVDAIGSVANFLQFHGWVRDAPVAFPITPAAAADPAALLAAGIIPTLPPAAFAAAGLPIDFGGGPVHAGPYALVDLENEDEVVYRAGTMNYYALTREIKERL